MFLLFPYNFYCNKLHSYPWRSFKAPFTHCEFWSGEERVDACLRDRYRKNDRVLGTRVFQIAAGQEATCDTWLNSCRRLGENVLLPACHHQPCLLCEILERDPVITPPIRSDYSVAPQFNLNRSKIIESWAQVFSVEELRNTARNRHKS